MSTYSFTISDFEELVSTDNDVDIETLREVSRFGVPSTLRGEVWKYLLGVNKSDKSDEISNHFQKLQENTRVNSNPRLSKEIKSHLQNTPHDSLSQQLLNDLEYMLIVYFEHNRTVEFNEYYISMSVPLLVALSSHSSDDRMVDLYYCFSRVVDYMTYILKDGFKEVLARFLMLFRMFEAELCEFFEEECIPVTWAVDWISGLLAKQLCIKNVLRLWDSYFSGGLWDIELHLYVCLAILEFSTEKLLECEYSEIMYFLEKLPEMDMDYILLQAENLRIEGKALNEPHFTYNES